MVTMDHHWQLNSLLQHTVKLTSDIEARYNSVEKIANLIQVRDSYNFIQVRDSYKFQRHVPYSLQALLSSKVSKSPLSWLFMNN